MKRVVFVVLGCVCSVLAHGQCFSGELATELHWNMKKKVNWTNQLRLNLSIPLWNGAGSIEASTLHMLRTNETIIDDWQGFPTLRRKTPLRRLLCWAICTSGRGRICFWRAKCE